MDASDPRTLQSNPGFLPENVLNDTKLRGQGTNSGSVFIPFGIPQAIAAAVSGFTYLRNRQRRISNGHRQLIQILLNYFSDAGHHPLTARMRGLHRATGPKQPQITIKLAILAIRKPRWQGWLRASCFLEDG